MDSECSNEPCSSGLSAMENGNDSTVDVKPETSFGTSSRAIAEDLLSSLTGSQKKRKQAEASFEDDDVEMDLKVPRGDESAVEEDLGTLEAIPRIHVHTLDTAGTCLHEVCVPHDQEYVPLKARAGEPAKEYAFVLDPFQTEALLCLDNNQSVLVSAHTSAGKTVVAEYAIAMSLANKQRVIFTSPIKALSNQKYREMFEEFADVGLMTGDVTINPNASCLVMTTEILRSMLYRGSEIMREVGWVVFDEIHYMRDKERGVVWEETIILLPDPVHYVFLSATIPNARQFAEWICFLHKQPCHVVYTDFRPVPLQHYIFPSGGDGLHLVVNEKSEFKEENFNTAMTSLGQAGDAGRGERRGRRGGTSGESNITKIVKLTMERNLAPVIIFSFARKDCEAYASQMAKLELNSAEEKKLVEEVYFNAIDILKPEDRELPQVTEILPILKRGIGIHHSGLLPILKETIEILFGEGLIKALFATETFAMGLNMPAKTVLFTTARKFDGRDFRWLSSGEYIQMSGRAGRRGKDDKGIVILMIDQQMSSEVAKDIIKGQPDALLSQFRLTYNMVLNLLRVEGINPEFMLERSFHQFQNFGRLPDLYKNVDEAKRKMDAVVVPQELALSGYHKIKQLISRLEVDMQKIITKPMHIVPFLNPGRLFYIQNNDEVFGWGPLINFRKHLPRDDPVVTEPIFLLDVLLPVDPKSLGGENAKPAAKGEKSQMEVVPVFLNTVQRVSQVRIFYPDDLKSLDNRTSVAKSIAEVERRFPEGLPLMDPVEDMQIKESELAEIVEKLKACQERLSSHPLTADPDLKQLYERYLEKVEAEELYKKAKTELKEARSLLQLDELKKRKRVLRRLQYANAQDVISLKGRVACEISAADELLLTEMIFEGVFNDLSVQQCTALLSCFVCQEKGEMPALAEDLSGILRKMQEMAKRIAKIIAEAKLVIDEETYVEGFKPILMDVVHEWCGGASFAQICKLTDMFEGSIIRCMRRLEELLHEMAMAAKAIGNADLEKNFSEAIVRIKRDIIFAASLYL